MELGRGFHIDYRDGSIAFVGGWRGREAERFIFQRPLCFGKFNDPGHARLVCFRHYEPFNFAASAGRPPGPQVFIHGFAMDISANFPGFFLSHTLY